VFESGSLYSPSVLDITEEDLLAKAKSAIANITAVSLTTSYPTQVRRSGASACLQTAHPAPHVPPVSLRPIPFPLAAAAVCRWPEAVLIVGLSPAHPARASPTCAYV
jgi:hypothetical protein